MCKSCICDTKPAISLNRSSLNLNLLQSVYRNSCTVYRLLTNLVIYDELWPTFPGRKLFPHGISGTLLVGSRRNLATLGGLANRNLFPEFRELWSRGPVIPCGDMHQFFTDTLVKWFFSTTFLCLPIVLVFFL